MAKKSKALVDLTIAGLNFVHLVKDTSNLLSHDVRLAGKSLAYIFVLFFFMFFLQLSVLISLFAMLFYYLQSLHFSTWASLWMVFLTNLLLLLLVFFAITRVKRNIFFPKIREKISYLFSLI